METNFSQEPALNLGWVGRTLCSAVEDIKEVFNLFTAVESTDSRLLLLKTLVHEIHVYGKRMEAALGDVREFESMKEQYKKLVEEVEKLKKEKNILSEDE